MNNTTIHYLQYTIYNNYHITIIHAANIAYHYYSICIITITTITTTITTLFFRIIFYELVNFDITHSATSFQHYEMIMVPRQRYYIPLYLGEKLEYSHNKNNVNEKFIQTKIISTPMVVNTGTVNSYLERVKNKNNAVKSFFGDNKSKSKSKSKNKTIVEDPFKNFASKLSTENIDKSYIVIKKNLLRDIGQKPDDEFMLHKKKIINKQSALKLFKGLIRGKMDK